MKGFLRMGISKGRPKGAKNKKGIENTAMPEKMTLNWVGKHKQWKTKREWETDDEFRKEFMEKGLPVRQCTNLSGGSLQEFYYGHDLEYARY